MKTTFISTTFIKKAITSAITATAITGALLASTNTLASDTCDQLKTLSTALFKASQESVPYDKAVLLLESRGLASLAFIADDAYGYEKIPTRKGQAIGAELFGEKYRAACKASEKNSI